MYSNVRFFQSVTSPDNVCRRYYFGRVRSGYALIPLEQFPASSWNLQCTDFGGVMVRRSGLQNSCVVTFYVWSEGRYRWAHIAHGDLRPSGVDAPKDCRWCIKTCRNTLIAIDAQGSTAHVYDIAARLRATVTVDIAGREVDMCIVTGNQLLFKLSKFGGDSDERLCSVQWEEWEKFGEPEGDVPPRRGYGWAALPDA